MASDYCTISEVKAALSLTGESFADPDISLAITAATRSIEELTDRRFWADADAAQIRYYTPEDACYVPIDDLTTLTALATDTNGGGTFSQSWTVNTDFFLDPLNAAADSFPYTSLTLNPRSSLYFPVGYYRSVRVTGKFGWPAVPAQIKSATEMLTARLLKRVREAPFGIASLGMEGVAVRVAREDPDVLALVAPFQRFTYC